MLVEWFQVAVGTVFFIRFRRVSISDTVRLFWVFLEVSLGVFFEFFIFRAFCLKRCGLGCLRFEQFVEDFWVQALLGFTFLIVRVRGFFKEFKFRLFFQVFRIVICLVFEGFIFEGVLWFFYLIVFIGGVWLFFFIGFDGLMIMLFREIIVFGLFFRDVFFVFLVFVNCRVMLCL